MYNGLTLSFLLNLSTLKGTELDSLCEDADPGHANKTHFLLGRHRFVFCLFVFGKRTICEF